MKTSVLICKIIQNEEGLEYSGLIKYIEELVKLGIIKIENNKLTLTEKGEKYINNI